MRLIPTLTGMNLGCTLFYRGTSLIKNSAPPRALQWDHAYGPMVALGGVAVSYERCAPVGSSR